METVKWSTIEAECGGFRAGFVATFRKYEGLTTDEKDGRGAAVKVTSQSFARHAGIVPTTFRGWLSERDDRRRGPLSGSARSGQMARQAVKSDKVSTDDKLGMLEDLMSDKKVLRAYRERRAPDVTEADAKTAEAWAKAVVAPIAETASHLQVPMWCDQIRDIAKELSAYEYEADEVRPLRKAITKLSNELEIQEFRLGLIDAEVPQ